MVTAIVLIRATMGRTPDIAEALLQLPEVSEVYSVTGEYDLVAMVRVQQYEQMADAVPTNSRASMALSARTRSWPSSATHDVISSMWGIGMESESA